ncbi:MAG: c-type cytochrome [Planctomycetales bacterium]|nr:c-type cytochrome [Planctomycetales bacterium]
MDHPRGLVYDNGSLWVLHPPTLSVFHDDDGDGAADRQETLVTGISTDQVAKRGADHTTNGIRMGIDGWIYIAVGDYGCTEARGTDGSTISRRGGGIVRVRPDGTDLEIYAWGLRNILDVSIDPFMNIFTRDNTNDGGGWDVRLSHILQSGEYGYPSLYKNFAAETMPPLADYGGGSGCGSMYLHDRRWPAPFADALYTCDWGRSEVYVHNLPPHGATFDAHQETFLKLPRPTDIDVDGSGRMYVSSWKDGRFGYDGPNIGFVAQVTPAELVPKPFPNLAAASDEQLIDYLAHASAVYRLHSQRELLRRGRNAQRSQALVALASQADSPDYGRAAAIFTLKQLDHADAHPALVALAKDPSMREIALRALTDRTSELEGVPLELFAAALADDNPRVRAQAIIGLGRLGDVRAVEKLLPLAVRPADAPAPTGGDLHRLPDPARVIEHLAVRSLVALHAVDDCLAALEGPYAAGALAALRYLHDEKAVSDLARRLSETTDAALRREILTTLVRLYYREGDFKSGWWGTRPDNSGPYFDRQTWEASEQIARTLQVLAAEADEETLAHLRAQLALHKVQIQGLSSDALAAAAAEPQQPIALPQADPNNKDQIANMSFEAARTRALAHAGDAELGKALFVSQSCIACHTYANGQLPKGPHLVDIGKRYKREELVESVLRPSAKIAQGFDTYAFVTADGEVLTGFVASESAHSVVVRDQTGLSREIATDEIEERQKQPVSIMPEGLVNNLTPEQLADLLAYLESLK